MQQDQRFEFLLLTAAPVLAVLLSGLHADAKSDSKDWLSDSQRFIGAWNLVSLRAEWSDNRVTEVWGSQPFGRLTYDSEGNMSALVMHERRNEASGVASEPEFQTQMAAYFGSYEVDPGRRVVKHRVAASIRVQESGVIERRYSFVGDNLVLAAAALSDGVAVTYILTWAPAKVSP